MSIRLHNYIEANRATDGRRGGGPGCREQWAREYCADLWKRTGNRWRLTHADDGALTLSYQDAKGKWLVYYTGRSGAFGQAVKDKIMMNHWSNAKAALKRLEAQEAEREADRKRVIHEGARDAAMNIWNAEHRHTVHGRG